MDRRVVLVALWVVFAAAAVGVGFGAAGLVGDPFTDGDLGTPVSAGSTAASGSVDAPTPTDSSGPERSATSSPASAAGSDTTRSQITRGGQVAGVCQDGRVRLSAAPAIGWEVDDLDAGAREEARARFERVDDGDGKVEVRATCSGGTPTFTVRDDPSDDDSGSDGSGSDD